MELVGEAVLFPGACMLSGAGQGPFVDTGRHYGPQDERIYIQAPLAVEVGQAVHMVTQEKYAAVLERVAELELAVLELGDAKAELERLEAAVRQTFASGGVRNPDGSVRLRPKPGQKSPRINEELVG